MELNFEKLPRFKNHSIQIASLLQEWADAHEVPRDAIVNQIYIAHAWADSNPKKAPKKNMARFLFSWMAAAKRYGNLRAPQKAPPARALETESDMTVEEMIEIRRRNMMKSGPANAA